MSSDIIWSFSTEEAFPSAEAHFYRICGIGTSTQKQERMKTQALSVYDEIKPRIQLNAVLSAYIPSEKKGNLLRIKGTEFTCTAFEQIGINDIRRAYAYLLTAGDFVYETERVSDLLFADIWFTAFMEAGRELLFHQMQTLAEKTDGSGLLAGSFGPGYYGMELSQVANFFQLFDANAVGAKLHESGAILPIKSCTGMYLYLKEGSHVPPLTCEGCVGNSGGCRYCKSGTRREEL